MASRDLASREGSIEQTTGRKPDDEARIRVDAAEVEAKLADMASRCTPRKRAGMDEWWACCRKMVAIDPVMAKIFAGFLPSDWDL
ncbi:hypothetical protein [Sphingobium sp.]|uniref:hypothetical protein n=1 Tax=Sphingobium sp. TaxID=1912891 RepID=UPI002C2417FC|nr:hypothetical protein [Sphingobium sp.]HUD91473.1 hypothetical protein [Sphingobium sp.]